MQLGGKVDAEWQRVVNLHAALIGIMVFFAGQRDPYLAARLLVFVFYSFNVVVSFNNLKEVYAGLRQINQDLMLFPPPEIGGHSLEWIRSRTYRHVVWLRSGLLALVWAVVAYLMFVPLLFERPFPLR